MTLTIKIDMDNEAFTEEAGTEVSRILVSQLVSRFDGRDILPDEEYNLRDINGNRVGKAEVTK